MGAGKHWRADFWPATFIISEHHFLLLFRSVFVPSHSIDTVMSSTLHYLLLIHSCIIQSGGCHCSEGMVRTKPSYSSCLAQSCYSSFELMMSNGSSRVPAAWGWLFQRLEIEGILGSIWRAKTLVELEQLYEASVRVATVVVMLNDLR